MKPPNCSVPNYFFTLHSTIAGMGSLLARPEHGITWQFLPGHCSVWPGVVCPRNKPASQSGVVPSQYRGETKSYLRENELYVWVKSCTTGTGQSYLAGESRLTGNRAGPCDTGIFQNKLLAVHQNTHSYHISSTLSAPYFPFKYC